MKSHCFSYRFNEFRPFGSVCLAHDGTALVFAGPKNKYALLVTRVLMLSFIQIYVLPFNAQLKVIPGQLTTAVTKVCKVNVSLHVIPHFSVVPSCGGLHYDPPCPPGKASSTHYTPTEPRNNTSCAKPNIISLTELCDTPASCSDAARPSASFPVPDDSGTNDMVSMGTCTPDLCTFIGNQAGGSSSANVKEGNSTMVCEDPCVPGLSSAPVKDGNSDVVCKGSCPPNLNFSKVTNKAHSLAANSALSLLADVAQNFSMVSDAAHPSVACAPAPLPMSSPATPSPPLGSAS